MRWRHSPFVIHGVISAMLPHVHAERRRRSDSISARGGGNAGAGLAGEEEEPEAQRARGRCLAPRGLREVERVGRRAVERARPQVARPLHGLDSVWPGAPAPKGKTVAPEPLAARERAPGAQVEAEERADQHGVGRPDARGPQDARVGLADARPVVRRRCRRRWAGRWCRWSRGCALPASGSMQR